MTKNSLLLLILLIAIGTGLYFLNGEKPQDEEGFACTMDALICPDGTGVGREGPQCTFTACTSTGPFIGELRQNENGFQLIMSSPEGVPQEVSYVMPLEIKVSNVLGTLVGKNVVVNGVFKEGNTLVVENIEESKDSDVTVGNVKIGETKFINGVKITLNSVPGDYRCPIDVQCIEAGAITANVTLQSDTDKETRNIASDEVPASFDSFKISIVGVEPPVYAGKVVDPNSYMVTFKVVEN